jgi:catechol-2,3-dioxygenase
MEKPTARPLVHPETRIGHVHLKVANIERALGFYRDLLGFEVTQWYGEDAVFLSAGGYHHHIGLNTWAGRDVPPAPRNTAGLFHLAILYPERQELARMLKRLLDTGYPWTGPRITASPRLSTCATPTTTAWNSTGTARARSGLAQRTARASLCSPGRWT